MRVEGLSQDSFGWIVRVEGLSQDSFGWIVRVGSIESRQIRMDCDSGRIESI